MTNDEECESEEYKKIVEDIEKLGRTEKWKLIHVMEENAFNETVAGYVEDYEKYKRVDMVSIFQVWLTRGYQVQVAKGGPVNESKYLVSTYINLKGKVADGT